MVHVAVKLLGVTLDSTLRFDKHVADVVRQCHYHIRALKHIRPLLTLEASKTFAVSIVGSKLDYCNCVLYGISQTNLRLGTNYENEGTQEVNI